MERLGKLEEESRKSRGWFSSWWGGGGSKDEELAEGTAISMYFVLYLLYIYKNQIENRIIVFSFS